MTTDRRQQVLRLYHLALGREADDRDDFLAAACAGDKDLERDVKAPFSLDPPVDFLGSPVINPEAERPFAGSPGLLIGQQIGAYRVDSRLGSGGMGEVYRATDTTLGRQVAIKVLPALLAHDPERRGRFEREAKALAALNHPNIAQVYGMEAMGVGVSALVMELVAGETLAYVLKKGRLPIDDALRYGAQIADALAAAHAHGILHRDVKPANVMIGASGVKVLDFGLAKWSQATTNTPETALPTAEGLTHPHEVLGTVAYMSPEQAEGKSVDARSDVFSLGIVLYEMLCGQPPFRGDTAVGTLAATLNAEPSRPRAMRREIPAAVERIVLRCLAKTPESRYSSAAPLHRALVSSLESRSVWLTRCAYRKLDLTLPDVTLRSDRVPTAHQRRQNDRNPTRASRRARAHRARSQRPLPAQARDAAGTLGLVGTMRRRGRSDGAARSPLRPRRCARPTVA